MSTAAPKAGITHARPKAKDEKKEGKSKGPVYPSEFGSHTKMVNADLKVAASKQDAADPWLILTDERGDYATRKSRLDTDLADPNRCADQPVREKMVEDFAARRSGSRTSMINEKEKVVEPKQDAADPWLILTDERGDYATRKSCLDTGMADPNRCADQPVREKLVKELTAA